MKSESLLKSLSLHRAPAICGCMGLLLAAILTTNAHSQEESADKRAISDKTLINDKQATPLANPLQEKFRKLMTGAKMTGAFTVDGRPLDKISEESYEIEKVEKQSDGDWWVITAHMKYGNKDFSVPVPVEVKWAGTTPVITLDKVTIPGYGTFSARVLFQGDRYAGTWQHDDKGGHMFGKIEVAK